MASSLIKFTEDMFREFVERDERRKTFEADARKLKTAGELVLKELFDSLTLAQRKSARRGDYEGLIAEKKGSVSWKEEFIRVAGPDKAVEIANAVAMVRFAQIRRRP